MGAFVGAYLRYYYGGESGRDIEASGSATRADLEFQRYEKAGGIGLGILLLLGARCMIFLEGCLSLICREIGEHCSSDVFFLVYSTFCIEDLLSSLLFVISFSSC